MLPGPVLRREFRDTAGWRDLLVLRMPLALFYTTVALTPALVLLVWKVGAWRTLWVERLRLCGGVTLIAVQAAQVLVTAFLVPRLVGGAIAGEREKNTFDGLLLTGLSAVEIVLAKLVGRLPAALAPAVVAWPLLALAARWTSLPPGLTCLLLAAGLSTALAAAAISVLASSWHARAGNGRGSAMGLVFLWIVVLPTLAFIPVGWGGGWTGLVTALRSACAWAAPTSPFSFTTNLAWTADPSGRQLQRQLLVLIGGQLALVAAAVVAAARSLSVSDLRSVWVATSDPTRGFRPPCGDDAIVWREFELPMRLGIPRLLLWSRHLLNLLRYGLSLLGSVFHLLRGLLQAVLMLTFPLGLLVAVVWLGYPALREAWLSGGAPGAPFTARATFNMYLRAGLAAMVALEVLSALGASAQAITLERNRKTWDVFLTTPLTGAEILQGKRRATTLNLLPMARLIVALTILGVACGGVHPLGALATFVDLAAAVAASLALGQSTACRSPSDELGVAVLGVASAFLFLVHSGMAWVWLTPARELAAVVAWDRRLLWLGIGATLAVPAASAWLARRLTREAFARFDEWAGRPRRPAAWSCPGERGSIGRRDDCPGGVSSDPAGSAVRTVSRPSR
jgi:hypothetical protein